MAKVTCSIAARWRWWSRLYLAALRLAVAMTGMEPNWDRVEWWLRRGLIAKVDAR